MRCINASCWCGYLHSWRTWFALRCPPSPETVALRYFHRILGVKPSVYSTKKTSRGVNSALERCPIRSDSFLLNGVEYVELEVTSLQFFHNQVEFSLWNVITCTNDLPILRHCPRPSSNFSQSNTKIDDGLICNWSD